MRFFLLALCIFGISTAASAQESVKQDEVIFVVPTRYSFRNADAVIVRRDGEPDKVVVKPGRLKPQLVANALDQLIAIRAIMGPPSENEVTIKVQPNTNVRPKDLAFANVIAANLPDSKPEHVRGVGEGRTMSVIPPRARVTVTRD